MIEQRKLKVSKKLYKFISNPYVYFFPLGTLLALVGGGVWLFSRNESYPSVFHSQTMIGAFLFSFISGFLMTAVPRMTGSFLARDFEVYGMLSLIIVSFVSNFFELNQVYYFVTSLSYFLLIYFVISRFKIKENLPPSFFVLILFGILSGIVGSILLSIEVFEAVGHALFFNGVVLFLVLGVGSRLVPALRGVSPKMSSVVKKEYIEFGLIGTALLISLIGEAKSESYLFGLIKCIATLIIAIRYWKIFSFVKPSSRLAYGMWGAAYMVIAGIILRTLIPEYGVQWFHLTYIGGFGMMTFTVASRVIISHGGHSMDFEKKSKAPLVVVVLLSLAAITRVAAPYFDYLLLLKWASAFWILGTLVWSLVFIPRCFNKV